MLPTLSSVSGARILAAACLFFCLDSYAQTSAPLISDVHTVAAAATGVPIEETFNIGTAGTYQLTLTDVGAALSPAAPLASVKLAISGPDNSLVTFTAQSGRLDTTKTQLIGAGSVTFSGQPGAYIIHVVGAPSVGTDGNTVPNSGPVSMLVTDSGNNQVKAFTDILAFSPEVTAKDNVGALSGTFMVPASGNYQVTLTDMQLPAQLKQATLAVLPEGGSPITDPAFGTQPGTPTATATIALQSGVTYAIVAGGQANTAGGLPNAGLYGVNVSPAGGGAPVYSKTVPVGSVTSVGTPKLTAGSYTLSLTDLQFPNALAQVGVVVTLNGQALAQLTATGTSSPFTAGATTYEVFTVGVANSSSQGSYTLSLQPATGAPIVPVLNLARAVSDPASGFFAYSFDTTVVSEIYTLSLADFSYPNAFNTLEMGVVQAGVQLDKGSYLKTQGGPSASEQISPAAGPLTLIVFAQPAAATSANGSGGLFGIDLTANGAGAPAFETSQGVGQLFSVQKASISSGGKYQVLVKDLGFPANFANLAVVVTRGTSKIGSIFGGGTLPFDAVGGDYLINFVAQPQPASQATPDQAGTYAMVVQVAPPAPTLTLQADPTTVASGGTSTLKWSSTNTTSCTGSSSPSGAWSGSVKTSDTTTTPALTATTTFTLTCTGTDGSTQTATQTVTVSSGSNGNNGGGGGGGGSIQADLLAALLGVLTMRLVGGRRATRS
jgi:hypothetical protein